MKKIFVIAILLVSVLSASAQKVPLDWQMHSFSATDSVYGASINKAYSLLKGLRPKKQVVIAYIGGGIDIEHEDLKDNLWTNPHEKLDGKDNDNNGYVDDIHGWNFLGTADGKIVDVTNNASTRELETYKKRFLELYNKEHRTAAENQELIAMVKKAQTSGDLVKKYFAWMLSKKIGDYAEEFNTILRDSFPWSEPTYQDFVRVISPKTPDQLADSVRNIAMNLYAIFWGINPNRKWSDIYANRYATAENSKKEYETALAQERDERGIIGDDINNLKDNKYGNNILLAGHTSYDTGAVGIFGAKRGNNIGIDGIADNAKVMVLRAEPYGDNYDKDIALALKYAIDKKADIIMLTGYKFYSPHKDWVNAMLQEAEKKNIVVVRPSGDMGGLNLDELKSYPSSIDLNTGREFKNFITVAASNSKGYPFVPTNYGKHSVDLFAPGEKIYSTDTGDNYSRFNGSQMAASVVTGVAAILKSYFPKLKASQIKDIIVSTATVKPDHDVYLPFDPNNGPNTVPATYNQLCKSGGIVDAAAAVKKALETK